MSEINVTLVSWGNEVGEVPVKLEILDRRLRPIQQRWVGAKSRERFDVDPGLFVVRASLASGSQFQKVVNVADQQDAECSIELHELSPHESHEWAYFTKPIARRSTTLLSDPVYKGAWFRLWRRETDGTWLEHPLPPVEPLSLAEDGVSCGFRTPDEALYAVQVGGPGIPWKFAAIPSTYPVMLLMRPVSGPAGQVHPLEVVVSSDHWRMEALLSLMQRGDTDKATDFAKQSNLAEELLFGKVQNTAAAAVGGYYLLRIGDVDRMHHWASNLANWFDWMADGPIIHAWQLIMEARRSQGAKKQNMDQARERLLSAAGRGFPIYTEGLRLLRDGLLLFDRRSKRKDPEIRSALSEVGAFTAAADWSSPATTFTGERPDAPTTEAPMGEPPGDGPRYYLYDVPIKAAVSEGALTDGEVLTANLESGPVTVRVTGGVLETEDGRTFTGTSEVQRAVGDMFLFSRQPSAGPQLYESLEQLRIHY